MSAFACLDVIKDRMCTKVGLRIGLDIFKEYTITIVYHHQCIFLKWMPKIVNILEKFDPTMSLTSLRNITIQRTMQ